MLQRKKQVSKEQGNSVGPNEDTIRYILFIGAVILVLVSIGLGIVYFTTPYRQVLKLNAFVYNDEGFYRMGLPLTPARYWWLRGVLTQCVLRNYPDYRRRTSQPASIAVAGRATAKPGSAE